MSIQALPVRPGTACWEGAGPHMRGCFAAR